MRLAALALLLLAAGCVTPAAEVPRVPGASAILLRDASGAPATLALVEARDASGRTLWLASAGLDGGLAVERGADVTRLLAWIEGAPFDIGADGALTPARDAGAPPLLLSERVAMPNPTFPVQAGTTCAEKTDGDTGCGLDEPSVVVDARGRVFYTAACCFLVSSPVFVSEDGGATFRALEHPLKDAYGNEGDLAVDDEGNLYYADIDLGTFGIARWNEDLEPQQAYRRPGEPLVDRPWIRAGAEGVVHLAYNTGSDTVYYRSTDHAETFEAVPSARFGSALGGAYSDVKRGIVGMLGGGEYMESTDAGASWGERTKVEGCEGDGGTYATEGVAIDEAGTRWHLVGACLVARGDDGAWGEPRVVIPDGLDASYRWIAAGAPGAVAVAFYAQVKDAAAAERLGVAEGEWRLFLALSSDADAAHAHWALVLMEDEAVANGPLGRALGDFLNVAIGPDGAVHVAYARNPEMDDSATAVYKRTSPLPGFAPSAPLVGPLSE